MGCVLTLMLGIGGGLLAGGLARYRRWYAPGEAAGFVVAVGGAIVILFLGRAFTGKR